MENQQILKEFGDMLNGISNDYAKEALGYVASCLNPETPSYEISISELFLKTYRSFRFIDAKHRGKFEGLVDSVEKILRERGYRTDYLTYQEHLLLENTQSIAYAKEPHKPIGIIEGDLTIEEANRARILAKKDTTSGSYFLTGRDLVQISLELLDENGSTIRDPQVLDDSLNPIETKYSHDFPFRRGQPNLAIQQT